MRIGIIAEFNPLHSGHKYLIEKARSYAGDDGEVICVMSEYFTQRGEVAITNGYFRAKEAINCGCDLVVALPYLTSVAYGDDFAKKSVDMLMKMGITHLIFGSEYEDVAVFDNFYKIESSEEYKKSYKKLLKEGYNNAKIMSKLLGIENNNPNLTLAYSYYKAIKKGNYNIKLIAVKREGQGLNDNNFVKEKYLSATAIRKNIYRPDIENYLTKTMLSSIKKSSILNEDDFYNLIKYQIISLGKVGLKEIYDVAEGLENRIYENCLVSENYEQLINNVSTKRYSRKRIQRILLHILTNTTHNDYKKYSDSQVFRVLAVKKTKTALIRDINNSGLLTLVPKLRKDNSNYFIHDIKVARIYNLLKNEKDIFKENAVLV